MRNCFSTIVLFLAITAICFGQDSRLPRDLDKLLPRIQEFWKLSVSGQKLKAAEFVIPAKKDRFVSASTASVSEPRFVGVEFTGEPGRVVVKTRVKMLAPLATIGIVDFVVSDEWVWSRNNWFLDLGASEDPFQSQPLQTSVDKARVAEELDGAFKLGADHVDLGTVLKGDLRSAVVPIEYTGAVPARIEGRTSNRLVWLDETTTLSITPDVTGFRFFFDASDFEGPFEFSFPISVRLNDVSVDRTFGVRGNVFAPLTLRQEQGGIPSASLAPFEVTLRNNTNEAVSIVSVMTDGKLDVVTLPNLVEAQSEGTIRLVRLSLAEPVPDRIWISLSKPVEGRTIYDFRLRWSLP
jgi:hypothetical protein